MTTKRTLADINAANAALWETENKRLLELANKVTSDKPSKKRREEDDGEVHTEGEVATWRIWDAINAIEAETIKHGLKSAPSLEYALFAESDRQRALAEKPRPRPEGADAIADLIEDCLDDNIDATEEVVRRYLVQAANDKNPLIRITETRIQDIKTGKSLAWGSLRKKISRIRKKLRDA